MTRSILLASMLVAAMALVGCGGDQGNTTGTGNGSGNTTANTATDTNNPATWDEPFKLTEEPEAAVDVLAALNDYEVDGEEIVVIGRIQDYVAGSFAVQLIDQSMEYCKADCECPTPWDYCCEQRDWKNSMILVSFTATPADGNDISRADRMYLKDGKPPVYRSLDLIKVVGKLKNSGDQKVLVATGYYHVERPEITWEVNWKAIQ